MMLPAVLGVSEPIIQHVFVYQPISLPPPLPLHGAGRRRRI